MCVCVCVCVCVLLLLYSNYIDPLIRTLFLYYTGEQREINLSKDREDTLELLPSIRKGRVNDEEGNVDSDDSVVVYDNTL